MKAIRKGYINKSKEKEGVLCELGAFYKQRGISWAIVACMKVLFKKMEKEFQFLYVLCISALFLFFFVFWGVSAFCYSSTFF